MEAFIGWLISGIIFGIITKIVASSKGYNGGFSWGFWLGFIGLLVVGFRPSKEKTNHYIYVEKNHESPDGDSAPQRISEANTESEILTDYSDMLKKLADLHQNGILTDEEYQNKKKDILDKWQ